MNSDHRIERRVPELDGIRGIAILGVLAYHIFNYSMSHRRWTGLAELVSQVTAPGGRGVGLFFVLSGFLITGILLDTRFDAHYLKNFYARRALRILPLYYVVLLVILLGYPHSGSYFLLSFFYLSNIAPILGITMINGAMWSLSVEEHFYLFWPLLIGRLQLRKVAFVAAGICVAEPIIRGLAYAHVSSVLAYSWFRLDGLASGALIACFVRSSRYSSRTAGTLVVGLVSVGALLAAAGSPFAILQHRTLVGAIGEFTTVNVVSAALVLWGAAMAGSDQTSVLRNRLLGTCGDLSYCLYLTHCIIMDAYDSILTKLHLTPATTDFIGVIVRAGVVLAASFIVAAISRRVLEGPALKLKRFFESDSHEPSRPQRAVAAGDSVT